MKKIFFFIATFMSLSINIYSQNLESDAIKFGSNNNDGTARYVAVGGAMSAIGGDLSNVNYNPAGIGIYNSTVLIFTPSYQLNKSDAVFTNSSRQNASPRFYVSNAGAVFSMKNKRYSAFNNFNLAFSYHSRNNFHQKNTFRRYSDNSITRNWVDEANRIHGNENKEFNYSDFSFETVGAYNTWLVNYDTTSSSYNSPISNSLLQNYISETKGGKNDLAISFSTNIKNKVYLGATIAVPFISYTNNVKHTETDTKDSNGAFEKFEMVQAYKNSGSGINAKIGVIYKPIDQIRLSASYQTNTKMNMKEEYTTDFVTDFDTVSFENISSLGQFEYDLILPWRANAGIAYVNKKLGFIAVDYELIDYSSTRFQFDNDYLSSQEELNGQIKSKYQMAHNIKVGLEGKYKRFRFRTGYALQTSPLKKEYRVENYDFLRQQFSGGIGFVWERVSLDATYRYSMQKQFEMSYDGVHGIKKDTDSQLYMLTLGVKLGK